MLRLLFILPIVLALACALCTAQDQPRAQGYVFAAPGGQLSTTPQVGTIHLGGGGEGFLYKGFAVGGEIGYLAPFRGFKDGIGIASVDGSYHFGKRDGEGRFVPFVTGGYSLAFRGGTSNLVNFGGGFTYWIKQRHGIRVEVRDHMNTTGDKHHLLGVRIAWAFR